MPYECQICGTWHNDPRSCFMCENRCFERTGGGRLIYDAIIERYVDGTLDPHLRLTVDRNWSYVTPPHVQISHTNCVVYHQNLINSRQLDEFLIMAYDEFFEMFRALLTKQLANLGDPELKGVIRFNTLCEAIDISIKELDTLDARFWDKMLNALNETLYEFI